MEAAIPRLSDSDRPGIGIVTAASTPLEHVGGKARGLVPEHQGQRPGEVDAIGPLAVVGHGGDAHQAQISEHAEHLLRVTAFDDRHVEECSGRSADRLRIGDVDRAAAEDYPVGPSSLGAADQGAPVARIAHVDADHQQPRVRAPTRRPHRPGREPGAGPRPGPAGGSPCPPPAPARRRPGGGPGCPARAARSRRAGHCGLGLGRGEQRLDVGLPVEGGLENVGAFHHERTLGPAGGALDQEAADSSHPGIAHPETRGRAAH